METLTLPLLFESLYLLSIVGIQGFLYGIAQFYKKKLDSATFTRGFLIAMVCLIAAMALNFIGTPLAQHGTSFLLAVGAILSLWNGIVLYYTMKQIRK
ncbi:hypothetical protein [Chitinivibrio alkaliphilus]|uniref:Uncharacterized protein n=1 Tax=Chitinivibrio alkaliphilus ACht1 TaxID=1313304 RepID=U7D8R8_9BACT|nr:hypothetical protein [Chitinivibrio alkaliphilus]ERP31492.1 hypothetical protein CALK_1536 [Chitinivibrio alkaliphilus ACht1]